jgi:hypothetical protein
MMRKSVVVVVLALAGCADYVRSTPIRIQAIQAISVTTTDASNTFCAGGATTQLRVSATFDDGKQLHTWKASHGDHEPMEERLDNSELQWMSSGGKVDSHGRFMATGDPLTTIGKPAMVRVSVRDQPDVAADLWLSPRYDCGTVIDLSGADGQSGSDGIDGEPGTATNGRQGRDGSDGRNGDLGEDGPMVDVSIGLLPSSTGPLVIARVTPALGTPRYAVFATDHGWLSISARGGAGGHGGRGGRGGNGAPGRSGGAYGRSGHLHLPVAPGKDGDNGRDGHDGAGGQGGTVTVHYDAAHPELVQLVEADTRGGHGSPDGADGPPMRMAPDQASVLFAKELARGVPIITNEPTNDQPNDQPNNQP